MGQKVFANALNYGAVTASDSTELNFNAVYVGVAGDVAIKKDANATAVTFVGVTAGSILPVTGKLIMSTNTTATSMVWLNW